MKRAAVFCSASYSIDPKFNDAAREAVRALHRSGWTVVSGGTVKGTMGVIADESASCGGSHVGIIPRFMEEVLHPGLSEVVWTGTMAERKAKMREGADAVIALPGGIGTLDEVIETLVLAKLGRFHGRILALDVDGFYTPFVRLLDHYVATGMLDEDSRRLISFPKDVKEMMEELSR